MATTLLDSNFSFPTSIPNGTGIARRTRNKTTGCIGKGPPTANTRATVTASLATSKLAKRSGRESEPVRIPQSLRPASTFQFSKTRSALPTRRSYAPSDGGISASSTHSETIHSSSRLAIPQPSTSTMSLPETPPHLHTMKTRVAVRDKTPHRFQIVPLREIGPKAENSGAAKMSGKKELVHSVKADKKEGTVGSKNLAVPASSQPMTSPRVMPVLILDSRPDRSLQLVPIRSLNIVKLPAKWTSKSGASKKKASSVQVTKPFSSDAASYFAYSAKDTGRRARTLSERDPNIPSLSKTINKHTRASTENRPISPATHDFSSNDASHKPPYTPAKTTISARGSPHFKSSSFGGMACAQRPLQPFSTSRPETPRFPVERNTSEDVASGKESTSFAAAAAAIKRRKRHATAYSLDVLETDNSNIAKFSPSRASCITPISRPRTDVRKAFTTTLETQSETGENVSDDQATRRESKRHAIYSRSIVITQINEKDNQSTDPPVQTNSIPSGNSGSFESILRAYRNSSSPSSAIRPVTPLSIRKLKIKTCDVPPLSRAGIVHHPIIQELISMADKVLCEWNTLAPPI
ncbi:hypothetical protein V5O48_004697 [Marasmius crinis-equi]|uniref:Uncharacterized protein n=1 Tax=Marasmius crinis-equi TaxID=585013 RepID=A0ABR3FPF1_9AGAR